MKRAYLAVNTMEHEQIHASSLLMKAKILISILFFLSTFSCTMKEPQLTDELIVRGENLIPSEPINNPGYWCTWHTQNLYVGENTETMSGVGGHWIVTRQLTEERVFGEDGWAFGFEKIKEDLILLFDLGWDVPATMNFNESTWKLGSQEVAEDKFPSCTGTALEKLKKLDSLTKNAGWRGTGIWLPSHAWHEGKDGIKFSKEKQESFFREKAMLAKDAGIDYWKVDYGIYGNDIDFREMVVNICKEVAPNLIVENCLSIGPLNDFECPYDCPSNNTGEYSKWCEGRKVIDAIKLLEFSQIFRTYDVTGNLEYSTTLDRVAQLLNSSNENINIQSIINSEDVTQIAAVLNCAIGIMRPPAHLLKSGPLKGKEPIRSDEVVRAVRWQRIAPPTTAGSVPVYLDSLRLTDTWIMKEGESWATWLLGKSIKQSAPARISRNMPLPSVRCDGEPPFVISSKHPSGAFAVATLARHDSINGAYYPMADVGMSIDDPFAPMGIFGKFNSLSLNFNSLPKKFKVYGQDLAGDLVYNITDFIKIKGSTITVSGKLIDIVGLSAKSEGDVSISGMIIRIIPE